MQTRSALPVTGVQTSHVGGPQQGRQVRQGPVRTDTGSPGVRLYDKPLAPTANRAANRAANRVSVPPKATPARSREAGREAPRCVPEARRRQRPGARGGLRRGGRERAGAAMPVLGHRSLPFRGRSAAGRRMARPAYGGVRVNENERRYDGVGSRGRSHVQVGGGGREALAELRERLRAAPCGTPVVCGWAGTTCRGGPHHCQPGAERAHRAGRGHRHGCGPCFGHGPGPLLELRRQASPPAAHPAGSAAGKSVDTDIDARFEEQHRRYGEQRYGRLSVVGLDLSRPERVCWRFYRAAERRLGPGTWRSGRHDQEPAFPGRRLVSGAGEASRRCRARGSSWAPDAEVHPGSTTTMTGDNENVPWQQTEDKPCPPGVNQAGRAGLRCGPDQGPR